MRLIDADSLQIETVGICDASGDYYGAADCVFAGDIANAPTIDPVKHEFWVEHETTVFGGIDKVYHDPTWITRRFFVCNKCRKGSAIRSNYCPNCGARMDAHEQTGD